MKEETTALIQSGVMPAPPHSLDGHSLSQPSLPLSLPASVGTEGGADPHDVSHGGSPYRLGSPTPVPSLGFEALLSAEAARLRWARNGAEVTLTPNPDSDPDPDPPWPWPWPWPRPQP